MRHSRRRFFDFFNAPLSKRSWINDQHPLERFEMSSVARKCVIIVAIARDQLAFQETKFFQTHEKVVKWNTEIERLWLMWGLYIGRRNYATGGKVWRSIPAKIQCCILHSTFRILSYICYLTSEFTLSSFNFPRATFKFLPCTFTFSYAIFKFAFKFSRLHFQVFAFNVEHLPIKFLLNMFSHR